MVGEGFWLVQKAAVQGGVAVQAAVRVMVCVGKGVCGVLRGRGGGCLRAGLCGGWSSLGVVQGFVGVQILVMVREVC